MSGGAQPISCMPGKRWRKMIRLEMLKIAKPHHEGRQLSANPVHDLEGCDGGEIEVARHQYLEHRLAQGNGDSSALCADTKAQHIAQMAARHFARMDT